MHTHFAMGSVTGTGEIPIVACPGTSGMLLQENLILLHVNSKGPNQPAHLHSLNNTFVTHALESILLAHQLRNLIFYLRIENVILPILSYPGCHMRAVHWLY